MYAKIYRVITLGYFVYRYLDSCSQVGGVGTPDIDVCESALDTPCDSFVQEDCVYNGDPVFEEKSVTDAHSCQRLLNTIGFAYGAQYFVYDTAQHDCFFYASVDFTCNSFSGPVLPDIDECNGASTEASTVETSSTDASTAEASSTEASTTEASSTEASTAEASSTEASTAEESSTVTVTVEASSTETSTSSEGTTAEASSTERETRG